MKKEFFGGLISVVLLGIYVRLLYIAVKVVDCVSTPGCTEYSATYFNAGMAQALSVIGGLVSALVIAELAITKPGEVPARRVLADDASPTAVKVVSIVSTVYLLVWVVGGLKAFLVGLDHPEELPALTTFGQAWLGLAVSAVYAYLGLKPPNG